MPDGKPRNGSGGKLIFQHGLIGRRFGDAGTELLIEEFLDEEEARFFVICDGTNATALVAMQDSTGRHISYPQVSDFSLFWLPHCRESNLMMTVSLVELEA